MRSTSLEEVVEWRDDSHADAVVVQRNVPEPALFAGRLDDDGRTLIATGVAIGVLPVGPDGAFVEDRVPDTQLEAVLQQSALTAGVDDHLGPHLAANSIAVLNLHSHGPRPLEQHVEHADLLVGVHAMFAAVVEHHLIELAAHDLPGLRTLVRLVVPEVERRGQLAAGADKLDTVLLDEVAGLHFRQHVEPLEHPVRFGNQRLADVKAREFLALEQRHRQPLLSQQRRGGRPGRPTADHDDVRLAWAGRG